MKAFLTAPDTKGRDTSVIAPSDTRHVYILTAGVAKTVTIPAGARIALFCGTGAFWVGYGGNTAIVPTTDITNGQAPELNPIARHVEGLGTMSLIAKDAAIVNVIFYS